MADTGSGMDAEPSDTGAADTAPSDAASDAGADAGDAGPDAAD
jgi:hypothetical protein